MSVLVTIVGDVAFSGRCDLDTVHRSLRCAEHHAVAGCFEDLARARAGRSVRAEHLAHAALLRCDRAASVDEEGD